MWNLIKFLISIIVLVAILGILVKACDKFEEDEDHKTFLRELGRETKETVKSLEEGWNDVNEDDYCILSHKDSMTIYYDIKNKIE